MKRTDDIKRVAPAAIYQTQGEVLKGQYVGAYRSSKGKLKGLVLRSVTQEYTIKLPKYLRPILVRELAPEAFVQVWAYPDEGIWQAINVMPLSAADIADLQAAWSGAAPAMALQTQPEPQRVCLQVCRKGKCYKQGSLQILQTLQAEVAANPRLQHVEIEAVGCMNACKKGPNLQLANSGKMINRLTPETALAILAECQ